LLDILLLNLVSIYDSRLLFTISEVSGFEQVLLLFYDLLDEAGLVFELVGQDVIGILHGSIASAQVLTLDLQPTSGLGLHLIANHSKEVSIALELGHVDAILCTGIDQRLAHLPLHLEV
jgi:hypothetical protein